MVAISLYRCNLHRVPDVPRRWPMPVHSIKPRDFKLLLSKRSRTLARLLPSPSSRNPDDAVPASDDGSAGKPPVAASSEGMSDSVCCPNPNSDLPAQEMAMDNGGSGDDGCGTEGLPEAKQEAEEVEKGKLCTESEAVEYPVSVPAPKEDVMEEPKEDVKGYNDGSGGSTDGAKMEVFNLEKMERKKDIEKKLEVLNEKKHHLVQMLKQILNAEEEMKRRTSIQPSTVPCSNTLQAEATVDTGSVARYAAPKLSVDVNTGSDPGGEIDPASNHTTQPHQMPCVSPAVSPFSKTVHGSLQRNSAFHSPRGSSVPTTGNAPTSSTTFSRSVSASPRFVPNQQGHSTTLPSPVSVSGIHFVASTPSPAASGATSSVFKDSHRSSPSWN